MRQYGDDDVVTLAGMKKIEKRRWARMNAGEKIAGASLTLK